MQLNPYESPRQADGQLAAAPRPAANVWTRLRIWGVRGGLGSVAAFFSLVGFGALWSVIGDGRPVLLPVLTGTVILIFAGSILSLLALVVGALGSRFSR